MMAETRTTKALRNVVFALTLTLTGATSMTNSSVAQAQTSSPRNTGVMVILTVKPGVAREQVMAVMPAEIRATVQLYLNGRIREWYSRGDGRGVKPVSIVELISTSTDAKLKSTRALLDTVVSGGTYGKDPNNKKEDNVNILCGNLYDALSLYLSKYDARAMFWAFNSRYGTSFDRATCIGSRQAALAEVGLD